MKYSNGILTTITNVGGISAVAGSMTVADPSKFINSATEGALLLHRASDGAYEIAFYTTVSGSTITLSARGQEGTTALAFAQGDKVVGRVTKAVLDALLQEQTDLANTAIETANNAVATAATAVTTATAALARLPVVTADIGADAVTGAKIADDAVDSEHIADDAVDTEHIADDAVERAQIGPAAVGTTEIENGTVTLAKLADAATNIVPNVAAYTITDIDAILPSAGTACTRPSFVNMWAYRTAGSAVITFAAYISSDAFVSSNIQVGQTAIGASFANNEPCNMSFQVPKGYWFKVVKVAGATTYATVFQLSQLGA